MTIIKMKVYLSSLCAATYLFLNLFKITSLCCLVHISLFTLYIMKNNPITANSIEFSKNLLST
jgi:hypothetical protein